MEILNRIRQRKHSIDVRDASRAERLEVLELLEDAGFRMFRRNGSPISGYFSYTDYLELSFYSSGSNIFRLPFQSEPEFPVIHWRELIPLNLFYKEIPLP
jgi:hypothetical protein